MTKLKVQLLLPALKSGKNSTKRISCQGVVVRTEPVAGEQFCNVAIFFNDITPRDAESIADYIVSHLDEEPTD